MFKTPLDFGIADDHFVRIDLDGEAGPHFYPSEYVVIESSALVVGDEIGIRVASYPYQSYERLETGEWQFRSSVGDYLLSEGPHLEEMF